MKEGKVAFWYYNFYVRVFHLGFKASARKVLLYLTKKKNAKLVCENNCLKGNTLKNDPLKLTVASHKSTLFIIIIFYHYNIFIIIIYLSLLFIIIICLLLFIYYFYLFILCVYCLLEAGWVCFRCLL